MCPKCTCQLKFEFAARHCLNISVSIKYVFPKVPQRNDQSFNCFALCSPLLGFNYFNEFFKHVISTRTYLFSNPAEIYISDVFLNNFVIFFSLSFFFPFSFLFLLSYFSCRWGASPPFNPCLMGSTYIDLAIGVSRKNAWEAIIFGDCRFVCCGRQSLWQRAQKAGVGRRDLGSSQFVFKYDGLCAILEQF